MSFSQNQKLLKKEFNSLHSPEELYQRIMQWSKKLKPFDAKLKIEANLVQGCQSIMYLASEIKEEKLYFNAYSDALISSGLAAILIFLYSGQSAEIILKEAPTVLEEIGIFTALTPGRSNGVMSLYLKMKQQALTCLCPQ